MKVADASPEDVATARRCATMIVNIAAAFRGQEPAAVMTILQTIVAISLHELDVPTAMFAEQVDRTRAELPRIRKEVGV